MQRFTTNNSTRPPHQPYIWPNNPAPAQPRHYYNNDCGTATQQHHPFQKQNRGAQPPFRPFSSSNANQRSPPNNNKAARQNPSTSNTANIVCFNCGRLGHYVNWCKTGNRQQQISNNDKGGPPYRNVNNENAESHNQLPFSSLIQLHLNHMLSTIKHTLPNVTIRTFLMAHWQQLHCQTPTHLIRKSTKHYWAMTSYLLLHKLHPT